MGAPGAALLAAAAATAATLASGAAARPQPVLYEISTRPWLYALAQAGVPARCGQYVCLRDVPRSEWERLADDKVDMVWLMGIWQLGSYGPKHDRSPASMEGFRHDLPDVQPEDVIGSPYAVTNYTVNTDIGDSADLAAVRSTLRELGMKLMLDFAPNHGAVDSALVKSRPGIFLERPGSGTFPPNWWIRRGGRDLAFGRGPYDGPWTDTLQYNYWSQDTVDFMTDVLVSIAAQADAIRCDMAMLMLNDVIEHTWQDVMPAGGFRRPQSEFWGTAIAAVRKHHPGTVLMGEAYDYYYSSPPEKQLLQELGFDFVYDKVVLDHLVDGNLDNLRGYVRSRPQAFFERTAHFVENHDEPRSASALGGQQQAFAGAVVASTLPGLRLFYFGEFDGFSAKLDVQLRRASQQQPNAALHSQYTALLKALSHDVFHTGSWTFIETPKEGTAWRLVAWRWASADGAERRLVVVNFSSEEGWASIRVDDAEGSGSIALTELLTGAVYRRDAREMRGGGLLCGLAPWTAQIFSYGRAAQQASLAVII